MSRKEPNKPLLHTNMYIMHVKRDQMKRKILLKMRRPAEQKYCSKYFQRMFGKIFDSVTSGQIAGSGQGEESSDS